MFVGNPMQPNPCTCVQLFKYLTYRYARVRARACVWQGELWEDVHDEVPSAQQLADNKLGVSIPTKWHYCFIWRDLYCFWFPTRCEFVDDMIV